MYDFNNSIDAQADLLAEVVDSPPPRRTVLADVRDQLVDLIGELKLESQRGSLPRLYFNALLQDLHILEEAGRISDHLPQQEASIWLEPFLDAVLAKLTLGAQLHPAASSRFEKTARDRGKIRQGSREWASLRRMLGGLLSATSHQGLRREAREYL